MRLRTFLRPVLHRVLPPVVKFYLRKPRRYRYDGLELVIQPGVFHPGMYISTRYFLEHIRALDLAGKKVLELGAGSGLISLWCARSGAEVTASDISSLAVENVQDGAKRNGLTLQVVQSDLFEQLPPGYFDFIFINPPYYPGTPSNEEAHAWYCGPEFGYFDRLFQGLGDYVGPDSKVLMVLSEDCELDRISGAGEPYHWRMQEIHREWRRGEWNYIFELTHHG